MRRASVPFLLVPLALLPLGACGGAGGTRRAAPVTTTTVASATTPATPATTMTRPTIAGEPALLLRQGGVTPKALVVYAHGYAIDENALLKSNHRPVVDALVAAGYAVVASRAGGDAWGNPASVEAYRAVAEQLRTELGTTRTFLLAESMGGASALLLVAEHGIPDLAGVVAVSPVTDLAPLFARDEYTDTIAAAFGGKKPKPDQSPVGRPAEAYDVPMRFYVSPDDTDVVTALETTPFVARLAGSATPPSVITCHGEHGDPSCAPPDGIVRWFDSILSPAPR